MHKKKKCRIRENSNEGELSLQLGTGVLGMRETSLPFLKGSRKRILEEQMEFDDFGGLET